MSLILADPEIMEPGRCLDLLAGVRRAAAQLAEVQRLLVRLHVQRTLLRAAEGSPDREIVHEILQGLRYHPPSRLNGPEPAARSPVRGRPRCSGR
ncbi:hypothetical protein [Limnochorda pilosa]|uniref:hypothetical protein n=1 Tax=Limnochorda pilosa TaxID=1555112 RepID=UPI0009EC7ECD|nr:hypothetical protein [Limnochorda pilosa]